MRKQYIMDQPLIQIMCALFYWRPNQKITREIWIQASLLHANYQHLKRFVNCFVNWRSIWRTPKSIFTNRVLGWHQLLICMILILGCQFCTATGAQLSSKEVLQQVAQSSFFVLIFRILRNLFLYKTEGEENEWNCQKERDILEPAVVCYVVIGPASHESQACFKYYNAAARALWQALLHLEMPGK